MNTKIIALLLCTLVLAGCQRVSSEQEVQRISKQGAPFQEHCFDVSEEHIAFREVTTTPQEFLIENDSVHAAINGVYFAADDDKPLGHAFLEGTEYATGRGDVRGFFQMLSSHGGFEVTEKKPEDFNEYHMVIGTHPILAQSAAIHPQALEDRYNKKKDEDGNYFDERKGFRSAIGNKRMTELCLVVSLEAFTMQEWAELLVEEGYKDAINLDGGSPSQLAVRGKQPTGLLTEDSRLIIFTTR